MKVKDKGYLTTPCCNKNVRANVNQNLDIYFEKKTGWLESGFDFSDPEVIRDYLWCENCGEEVELVEVEKVGYKLKLKS